MTVRVFRERSGAGAARLRAAWSVAALVTLGFAVARALGVTDWPWLVVSQIVFVGATWAAVAGIAYALRASAGDDGRGTWVALVIGGVLLALGETYYSVFQVLSDIAGPPTPSVFDGFILAGGLVLVWALAHRASLGSVSRLEVLRSSIDSVAIATLALVALYSFATWMVDDLDAFLRVSLDGVAYIVVGVAMMVIVSANVASARRRQWSRWQAVFGAALWLYGLSMALWPIARFMTRDEVAVVVEVGIATFFVVAYLLMMIAGLYRVNDGTSDRRAIVDLFRHRPRTSDSVLLSTVLLGSILSLGISAFLTPDHSADPPVYFGFMVLLGALMVARTMAEGARAGMLRVSAGSDPLTGLMNLRSIRSRLGESIRVFEKYGEPVSVVLFDLDDFERANLLYGRAEGDRLLCDVADRLSAAVGQRGSVGRIGGDEFVVVLQRTSVTEAADETARLRDALHTVLTSSGLPLTASWGIAACPDHAAGADELLRRADAAQYWAKHHGKDRVIVYDPAESGTLEARERPLTVEARADLDVLLAVVVGYEARISASRFHSRNVAALTVLVAERVGVASEHVGDLETAALLHDVGMIGLPDRIGRTAILGNADSRLYREHVTLGESIVAASTLSRVAPLIRAHHERWDGQGYPDSLTAEEIPLGARIIAVCDAFERMTTGSGASPSLSRGAALQALDQEMGSAFDPAVVEAAIQVVADLPSEGWMERGGAR